MSTIDLTGAVCAQTDPEMWFPTPGKSPAAAKKLCVSCPARTACLDTAMRTPVLGVWGGTTVAERRALAQTIGRSYNPDLVAPGAGPPTGCGTPSGARRHYRAGEPVCEPCRHAANNAAHDTRALAGAR
jgi:hypothetical protein